MATDQEFLLVGLLDRTQSHDLVEERVRDIMGRHRVEHMQHFAFDSVFVETRNVYVDGVLPELQSMFEQVMWRDPQHGSFQLTASKGESQ